MICIVHRKEKPTQPDIQVLFCTRHSASPFLPTGGDRVCSRAFPPLPTGMAQGDTDRPDPALWGNRLSTTPVFTNAGILGMWHDMTEMLWRVDESICRLGAVLKGMEGGGGLGENQGVWLYGASFTHSHSTFHTQVPP